MEDSDVRLLLPGSVTEDDMRKVFFQLETDGVVETIFFDKTVTTSSEFLDLILDPYVHPYFGYLNGEPCGVCWLNNPIGRGRQIHFAVYKKFWGKEAVHIGREATQQILRMKMADGSPYLLSMFGLTRISYRLAIRFMKKIGFREVGILPNAITTSDGVEDGLISSLGG